MTEREWVNSILNNIQEFVQKLNSSFYVETGKRLPYSSEVISYNDKKPLEFNTISYQTDILVSELIDNDNWKPRIIIEAKINSVTTHDAITYSQKDQTHKYVHPYLRYGILIGNRKYHPLPGRLFRHGEHFDFMQSWRSFRAEKKNGNYLLH